MPCLKLKNFLSSETVLEYLSFIFNILKFSSFELELNPKDFDNIVFFDSLNEFFNFPLNFLKYKLFSSFVSTVFCSSIKFVLYLLFLVILFICFGINKLYELTLILGRLIFLVVFDSPFNNNIN